MRFCDFLDEEWKPALGCTEPASIAYAASSAASLCKSPITSVNLLCDPRIYKNCYAVGIPHSGHKVGKKWMRQVASPPGRSPKRNESSKCWETGWLSTASMTFCLA